MNAIVDTAPPPVLQLPRIEPTDILRAAGHMGIGTAAGHTLATQLMAAAALARAKGAELSHRMRTEAQEIRIAHQHAASVVDNLLGKLADSAADLLEKLDPGEIIARSGVQKAQSTLNLLMHVNLPDGLSSLI